MSRRVRPKLSSLTSNTSLDNKLVFKRLKVELYCTQDLYKRIYNYWMCSIICCDDGSLHGNFCL